METDRIDQQHSQGRASRGRRPWRRLLQVVFGASALLGGCQCEIRRVIVNLPSCQPLGVYAVDDSFDMTATAFTDEMPNMFSGRYYSWRDPGLFGWSVSPSSLASVSSDGRVRGERVGTGRVFATVSGVMGSQAVSFVSPSRAVHASVEEPIAAGDTARIAFTLSDTLGQPLAPDGPGRIIPDVAARLLPLNDTASGRARFVARVSGPLTFTWCYAGRTGMQRIVVQP